MMVVVVQKKNGCVQTRKAAAVLHSSLSSVQQQPLCQLVFFACMFTS
jgi:hypothetical protein